MFIIRSLISLGYWSSYKAKFSGIIYATRFESEKTAVDEMAFYIDEPCEIIRIYEDLEA
jgi:hypothetical protein